MSEISLYRKYRPHNFDNLVGQDHIKTTLINALKIRAISHAYLFTGPRGTGKTSTARIIAKALTCTNLTDGYEPCDNCEFCSDINEGRLIDLIEVDAASNRGIDEIRDLKEKINFAPSRTKVKIYIIDEVHMMTKEAFNALLKTLEEPPDHAYFILATTEIHKIPATIISRCQRFDFRRIDFKTLVARLAFISKNESIEAEEKALEAISKYADGGLRDAIGLLQQLTLNKKLEFERVYGILGLSDLSLLEKLFTTLMESKTADALSIIDELHSHGSDLKQFVHEFVDNLRQKMLTAVQSGDNPLAVRLIEIIENFQEANLKLNFAIPQLALEIAIIKTTKGKNIEKTEEKKVEEVKNVEVTSEKIEEMKVEEKISDVNIKSITSHWPRVMERIKSPSLRMSLKNARPSNFVDNCIVLEFGTNFHKEKVMEHAHRVELEEMLKNVFNQGLKVSATVKTLEIDSMVKDEDNLDEALKIFGGQVVE